MHAELARQTRTRIQLMLSNAMHIPIPEADKPECCR